MNKVSAKDLNRRRRRGESDFPDEGKFFLRDFFPKSGKNDAKSERFGRGGGALNKTSSVGTQSTNNRSTETFLLSCRESNFCGDLC